MQEFQATEKKNHAGFFTQCLILTRRSFVNMYREVGYYWLRLIINSGLALSLGTIFHDVGLSSGSIQVTKRENINMMASCALIHLNIKEIILFIIPSKTNFKVQFNFDLMVSGQMFTACFCCYFPELCDYWWIPFVCRGDEGKVVIPNNNNIIT